MLSKDGRVMVTVRELIDELRSMGSIDAEIVDNGDLNPRFAGLNIDYDEESGEISIDGGYYRYAEDSCMRGIDPGLSEATVCGVTFSKPILGAEEAEIDISGDDIDYDEEIDEEDEDEEREELTESDVLEAAEEVINFPAYDVDDYPFDISDVDEDEIKEVINEEIPPDGIFLQRYDGRILCLDGCEIITRERAIELLVEQAKEVDYDVE